MAGHVKSFSRILKIQIYHQEKEWLVDLLVRHGDVFADTFAQIGRTKLYEHAIRLRDLL